MGDLCMWVGEKHYPWPNDFSDEAKRDGVSKRVPRKAIPYIEPGRTRLALIHPKAIVRVTAEGMTLYDLAVELTVEHAAPFAPAGWIEPQVEKFVEAELLCDGQSTSGLTALLRKAQKAKDLKRLEEKYGIEYQAGVFGWCPLTAVHYVAQAGESEIPADLEGVQGIKMVQMDYSEDEGGLSWKR